MKKTALILLFAAFLAVFALLIKDDGNKQPHTALKHDALILAFGDSLTYGSGVNPDYSYPSRLALKTSLHVINAGIPGEVSSEGLKRLAGLLEQNPDIVIICHGGNDILRKHSHVQLKKNILAMIGLVESSGAQVLLVGVPDFGWLGYRTLSLYEEAAEEAGVMFEADILGTVVSSPALKSDRIHPNEKGYEMMADAFIGVLKSNGVLPAYE